MAPQGRQRSLLATSLSRTLVRYYPLLWAQQGSLLETPWRLKCFCRPKRGFGRARLLAHGVPGVIGSQQQFT
jgi:hypothetical protein